MPGIILTIEVDDKGSVKIKQFSDESKKAFKEMQDGPKQAAGPLNSLRDSWMGFTAKIALGTAAIYAAKKAFDFMEEGVRSSQIEATFMKITRASGIMGNQLIEDIKRASGVFVEDTELMVKAQRALVQGLDPKEIVSLTEAARTAARMMGITVKDAFDTIMESVISLRTRGLRPAFPDIKEETDLFAKLAITLGVQADQLNITGQRQAIVNEILRQNTEVLKILGPLHQDEYEKMQQTRSAWAAAAEDLSKMVAKAWEWVKAKGALDMAAGMKVPESIAVFKVQEALEEESIKRDLVKAEDQAQLNKQLREEGQIRENIYADQIKMQREITNVLLEKEKDIRKEILALQKQLTDSQASAIEIMDRLEIPTMASFKGWTEGLVKEYETVLGSNLFSGTELEEAKQRYIDALNWAKEQGGYSAREYIDEINEAVNKIETMTPAETSAEKARQQIIELERELKNMQAVAARPVVFEIIVDPAIRELNIMEDEFDRIREKMLEPIPVTMNIIGYGSSGLPIMEKIEQIYGGFDYMQEYLANLDFKLNMSSITEQIESMKAILAQASMTSPSFWRPGAYYEYQKGLLSPQIAALEQQKALLLQAQAAFAGGGYSSVRQGGGGGGGVSININTINLMGGTGMEMAIQFDAAIAELIEKDRSRIKAALS